MPQPVKRPEVFGDAGIFFDCICGLFYIGSLLSAAPSIKERRDTEEITLKGEVPSALDLPSGCCFRTRCPFAWDRCAQERPVLQDVGQGQTVACHLVDEPERDTEWQ